MTSDALRTLVERQTFAVLLAAAILGALLSGLAWYNLWRERQ